MIYNDRNEDVILNVIKTDRLQDISGRFFSPSFIPAVTKENKVM